MLLPPQEEQEQVDHLQNQLEHNSLFWSVHHWLEYQVVGLFPNRMFKDPVYTVPIGSIGVHKHSTHIFAYEYAEKTFAGDRKK